MYKGYKQKQITVANMIEKMYEILFNMWELRNQILHDKTNIHPILGEAKMNDEIITQLNLGKENLLPNDYHLINTTPEQMFKLRINEKQEWLNTIEAARACKKPQRYRSMAYARRGMRRFLKRKRMNSNRQSEKNR